MWSRTRAETVLNRTASTNYCAKIWIWIWRGTSRGAELVERIALHWVEAALHLPSSDATRAATQRDTCPSSRPNDPSKYSKTIESLLPSICYFSAQLFLHRFMFPCLFSFILLELFLQLQAPSFPPSALPLSTSCHLILKAKILKWIWFCKTKGNKLDR